MKRQHPTEPNLFWCPKCQTYKAREEFNLNQLWCKLCQSVAYKQWAQRNKDRKKEYQAIWTKQHPDNVKKHNQTGYKKHKKERNFKAAKYNKEHPTQVKETMRRNYEKYRDDRLLSSKINHQKRKESLTDVYVKMLLNEQGLAVSLANIELKRTAIQIKRIEREMINELR